MYNPPHPGEFIKEVYLEPLGATPRSVALRLKVSFSTFSRLIKGQSSISPEMALRLSKCIGRRSNKNTIGVKGCHASTDNANSRFFNSP